MNCEEFEERVQCLLDGRVPLATDAALFRHAQGCRQCQRLLDAYETLWAGLEVWEPPPLPADFARHVVQQVTPAPLGRPRVLIRAGLTALAALAAALLLALLPAARNALTAPTMRPVARLAPARPATDHAPPRPARDSEPRSPQTDQPIPPSHLAAMLADPAALHAVWRQWRADVVDGPLRPMDGIAGGLRPITVSLTEAIDVLRSTLPIGGEQEEKKASGDSASIHRPELTGIPS